MCLFFVGLKVDKNTKVSVVFSNSALSVQRWWSTHHLMLLNA